MRIVLPTNDALCHSQVFCEIWVWGKLWQLPQSFVFHFCGFSFEGRNKTLLNVQEENLTMDITSFVTVFFSGYSPEFFIIERTACEMTTFSARLLWPIYNFAPCFGFSIIGVVQMVNKKSGVFTASGRNPCEFLDQKELPTMWTFLEDIMWTEVPTCLYTIHFGLYGTLSYMCKMHC